jgi:NAD-dependent dihydropyrimidine dehydrogenase PreA subunit
MTHVIAQPCISCKDGACVTVCPVDCIHSGPDEPMYYIDPAECIDCGCCIPVCPVEAIFAEDDLPAQWVEYKQINADFFRNLAPSSVER